MKQFGLSKEERIKSKKEISLVYSKGSVVFSHNRKLKANFYSEVSKDDFGVKVAFGVHRKSGNAVWRNRIKRLLRSAYRLNKAILVEKCEKEKKSILLIFSLNSVNQKHNKKIYLKDLETDVVDLMQKVNSGIQFNEF